MLEELSVCSEQRGVHAGIHRVPMRCNKSLGRRSREGRYGWRWVSGRMETGRRVGWTCLDPARFCDSRQIGVHKCCNKVTNSFKLSRGDVLVPLAAASSAMFLICQSETISGLSYGEKVIRIGGNSCSTSRTSARILSILAGRCGTSLGRFERTTSNRG